MTMTYYLNLWSMSDLIHPLKLISSTIVVLVYLCRTSLTTRLRETYYTLNSNRNSRSHLNLTVFLLSFVRPSCLPCFSTSVPTWLVCIFRPSPDLVLTPTSCALVWDVSFLFALSPQVLVSSFRTWLRRSWALLDRVYLLTLLLLLVFRCGSQLTSFLCTESSRYFSDHITWAVYYCFSVHCLYLLVLRSTVDILVEGEG